MHRHGQSVRQTFDSGDAQSDEECRRDDEESSDDDHQSLVMSQRVWDDVDDQGGTGDECSEELEEQDPGFSQIRSGENFIGPFVSVMRSTGNLLCFPSLHAKEKANE